MRENIRIESPLKSRRIRSRELVDERCWAFMKELREHHKGKAVYEINPYAEVYPVRENVYAIFNESLDGAGDVWIYLIVGEEKAMVIDTGFGLGDLKGLCEKLSGGKELIVVNTHPHIDHAYGNCQFEQVYCHEYAVPQLMAMNRPDAWEHLFDEQGTPIWTEFDRRDLIAYRPYRITGVPDGYEFSLGNGHLVELIFTAGHASGHCMFLDKKNRLLFAGDDVISMRIGIGGPRPGDVYGAYATVVQYRNQMRKLASRLDEFDYVFPGHFVFDLGHEVIEDLAKTAEAIVAEPEAYDYAEEADTPGGRILRMCRFVPGLGTIAYTEKSIGVDC